MGSESLGLSQTEQSLKSDFLRTFLTMTEEQRQQYLKDNFNQQPARIAMTPISEKDTIYEQTSKGSL